MLEKNSHNDSSTALAKLGYALAGLSLGYCIAHVIVFYGVKALLLETMGIKAIESLDTGIRAAQVLVLAVFAFVVRSLTRESGDLRPASPFWTSLGIAAFVVAALIRLF